MEFDNKIWVCVAGGCLCAGGGCPQLWEPNQWKNLSGLLWNYFINSWLHFSVVAPISNFAKFKICMNRGTETNNHFHTESTFCSVYCGAAVWQLICAFESSNTCYIMKRTVWISAEKQCLFLWEGRSYLVIQILRQEEYLFSIYSQTLASLISTGNESIKIVSYLKSSTG